MRGLLPVLVILLAGCADTHEHTHGRTRLAEVPQRTRLVVLRPGGAPADVSLPTDDTVLFLENGSADQHLSLAVHGAAGDPTTCPAVLGFTYDEEREIIHSTTTIPPGGFATLCLNQLGSFRYEVWFEGRRAGEGTIRVAEDGP